MATSLGFIQHQRAWSPIITYPFLLNQLQPSVTYKGLTYVAVSTPTTGMTPNTDIAWEVYTAIATTIQTGVVKGGGNVDIGADGTMSVIIPVNVSSLNSLTNAVVLTQGPNITLKLLGQNIQISSYDAPLTPATTSELGGVIVPTSGNLTVDVLGNIGVRPATVTIAGSVPNYANGTFPVTAVGMTVPGIVVYKGNYVLSGNVMYCTITVEPGTSFASTVTTSYFTGMPFLPTLPAVCSVTSSTTANYGVGNVTTNGRVYIPSITTTTSIIIVTFTYQII